MSSVPPNLVGPILQSHMAQRQVSGVRNNEESQKATATRQQSNAIDEKDTTVETTDNDTQVYTDSQGSGSKGRDFSEPEGSEDESGQPASSDQN